MYLIKLVRDMDHDDEGETSYNPFVDDVAFEPTYSQALLGATLQQFNTYSTANYSSRSTSPRAKTETNKQHQL